MAIEHTSESLRPFLQLVTTVAEAEQRLELHAWSADALMRWERFVAAVRPGDHLWFFRDFTPPRAGLAGYVIERDGALCESLVTERY